MMKMKSTNTHFNIQITFKPQLVKKVCQKLKRTGNQIMQSKDSQEYLNLWFNLYSKRKNTDYPYLYANENAYKENFRKDLTAQGLSKNSVLFNDIEQFFIADISKEMHIQLKKQLNRFLDPNYILGSSFFTYEDYENNFNARTHVIELLRKCINGYKLDNKDQAILSLIDNLYLYMNGKPNLYIGELLKEEDFRKMNELLIQLISSRKPKIIVFNC